MALFGWYVWAFLTYFIGTKLLPEPQTHATHKELLRTIAIGRAISTCTRIMACLPHHRSINDRDRRSSSGSHRFSMCANGFQCLHHVGIGEPVSSRFRVKNNVIDGQETF